MKRSLALALIALALAAFQPPAAAGDKESLSISVLPSGDGSSLLISVSDGKSFLLSAPLKDAMTGKEAVFSDGQKGRYVTLSDGREIGVCMWGQMPGGFLLPDGSEATVQSKYSVALPPETASQHPEWVQGTLESCKAHWDEMLAKAKDGELEALSQSADDNRNALTKELMKIYASSTGVSYDSQGDFKVISADACEAAPEAASDRTKKAATETAGATTSPASSPRDTGSDSFKKPGRRYSPTPSSKTISVKKKEHEVWTATVLPSGEKSTLVIRVDNGKEVLLDAPLMDSFTEKEAAFSDGKKGKVIKLTNGKEIAVSMWEHLPSGFIFPDGIERTVYSHCTVRLTDKEMEDHPKWLRYGTLPGCQAHWSHEIAKVKNSLTPGELKLMEKDGRDNYNAFAVRLMKNHHASVGIEACEISLIDLVSRSEYGARCGSIAAPKTAEDAQDKENKDDKTSKPSSRKSRLSVDGGSSSDTISFDGKLPK